MNVRQVTRSRRWPSGDSTPLAVLTAEPSELASRFRLTFEEARDDLDELELAAILLADGSQAWLYKHRSDPNPGTVVRVDAGADLAEAKDLLRHALDLDDDDFLWLSPHAASRATLA